jgi:hypothetical protein
MKLRWGEGTVDHCGFLQRFNQHPQQLMKRPARIFSWFLCITWLDGPQRRRSYSFLARFGSRAWEGDLHKTSDWIAWMNQIQVKSHKESLSDRINNEPLDARKQPRAAASYTVFNHVPPCGKNTCDHHMSFFWLHACDSCTKERNPPQYYRYSTKTRGGSNSLKW